MAHLHLLGVAGSFMAGVARLAQEAGHTVSGSDRAFYPPFGEAVRQMDIALHKGYEASSSDRPADLYIVGNAISRGNPLMESILRDGRPFISAPQWLCENILRGRQVIAVAGTHGKTTTTALLVHLLQRAGHAPGFLVGGILPGAGVSAALAPQSPLFVIEADEYDSAYFDKRPKFLHYHPFTAVLNNLEFDHADIYPDIAAIIRQFHYLLRSVPDSGHIIARGGDSNIAAAIDMGCYSPVQYLGGGSDSSSDWRWQYKERQMHILRNGKPQGDTFAPPLAGAANRDNILAAVAAAATAGVDPAQAGALLQDFQPPLRRLQLVHQGGGIRVFDDFAHHPTAIAQTIAALAEERGGESEGRLIAVFEPRSNTMKAGVFREQWQHVFNAADAVVAVGEQKWLPEVLQHCAGKLHIAANAAVAADYLRQSVRVGDDILLMSNGDFGDLAGMLAAQLEKQ